MKNVLIQKNEEIALQIGLMIQEDPLKRYTTTELLDFIKMASSDTDINFAFDEASLKLVEKSGFETSIEISYLEKGRFLDLF